MACMADGQNVCVTFTGKQRRAFDLCATDAEVLGYALIQEAHVALNKELPATVFIAVPYRYSAGSGKRPFPESSDNEGVAA